MKIILSPAKTMKEMDIAFKYKQYPMFVKKTEELQNILKTMSCDELANLLTCNDKIAQLNYQRYQTMNLYENLSCAVFTYEGLAYQHLAANVMTQEELDYLEKHFVILSGFYGILRPFDGIRPYRLEMQTKLSTSTTSNLYEYWKDSIANELYKDNDLVINLASNEYSKCITPYLFENRKMITCVFAQNIKGKLKTKPTEAKMCRGYMVRYMATHQIEDVNEIKKFNYKGYIYNEQASSETQWVFIKQEE